MVRLFVSPETPTYYEGGNGEESQRGNSVHFIRRRNEELISLNVSGDENKVAAQC